MMKPVVYTLILIFATTGLAALTEASWHETYDSALAESQKTGAPLVVVFTGTDWCHWCEKLDRILFNDPTFNDAVQSGSIVAARIDFPRHAPQQIVHRRINRQLAKRFQVDQFPTVLIMDSGTETVLHRHGFISVDPATYVDIVQSSKKSPPSPG